MFETLERYTFVLSYNFTHGFIKIGQKVETIQMLYLVYNRTYFGIFSTFSLEVNCAKCIRCINLISIKPALVYLSYQITRFKK